MPALGITTDGEVLRVAGPRGELRVGGGLPFVLIAGPCVIEEEARVRRIAAGLARACADRGVPLVFKASFDKANRTSLQGHRGPGLAGGLAVLAAVRAELGLPVTTDVHLPEQAAPAAQVVDLLQIPAFLCRQTDLLLACAATGRPVNLKKGQFLAPREVLPAVEKLRAGGAGGVLVTERGVSFGYHNLVVDLRSLPTLRSAGVPVCFDGTHSVQQPGGLGDRSGGDRAMVPFLTRGAVAAGVDAVFLEVHDAPEEALSDGPNMVRLSELPRLLDELVAIDRLVKA